jgi:O-methyltransferase
VERLLRRSPALYRFACRILYRADRSFYSLSPGLPAAVRAAMAELHADGLLHTTDYYEFGVFRGYGLREAQQSAQEHGARATHFYGFDSFQGLPEVEGIDEDGSMFFEGQFACSREFVENALRKTGADLETITLVEGFFHDSLTSDLKAQYDFKPVGVAVIDCDLYASTVPVLSWLDDLVQPGSILMMDDWRAFGSDPDKGQPLALREWLAQREDLVAEPMFDFEPHGRAFKLRAPN